jgi:hypothetical protein
MAVAAFAACLVALLWWQAEPAHSATKVPTGFTDKLVAQVNNTTSMAIAPDGRIFVVQKGGKIRVIKNGQLLSKPFITLTTDASFFRGLLGITFDPNSTCPPSPTPIKGPTTEGRCALAQTASSTSASATATTTPATPNSTATRSRSTT